MNILFASNQIVSTFGEAGGVRNEILSDKIALEELGHKVDLFDPWKQICWDNYEIFHLFAAGIPTYPLFMRAKKSGIKCVVSPIIDRTLSNGTIRFITSIVNKMPKLYTNIGIASKICKQADFVFVRSEEEKGRVISGFGVSNGKVRIVPIYTCFSEEEISPSLFVGRYGIENFLLAVGDLGNPRKNFLKLVQVVGNMDIPLVLIGPVSNGRYLEKLLKEANKYKNVHILGYVEKKVLMSAYAAANAVILPSIVEGVGRAALEAGLVGANIIITKKGGTSFYFKQYAMYIDPFSRASIRKGILETFYKPKNNKLKDYIKLNFNKRAIGERLESCYREVLSRGSEFK